MLKGSLKAAPKFIPANYQKKKKTSFKNATDIQRMSKNNTIRIMIVIYIYFITKLWSGFIP